MEERGICREKKVKVSYMGGICLNKKGFKGEKKKNQAH